MLCCPVDDLLVVGRQNLVEEFFGELEKKIDITYKEVKGNTSYLGRRLEMRENEVIFGVDPKYVDSILEDAGLKDLKGTTEMKWEKEKDEEDELDNTGQAEYRSLVGQLMWIDRADTRKTIGRLATKLGHATLTDRKNAMHVIRYLKGVPTGHDRDGRNLRRGRAQAGAHWNRVRASGRRLGR